MIGSAVVAVFQMGLVGAVKVDFANPVPINLQSVPVSYRGSKLSIVRAGKCSFALENRITVIEAPEPEPGLYGVTWNRIPETLPPTVTIDSALKVTLSAAITQYNTVDYRLSGAVFDGSGKMLGVSSLVEHVDYVRVGVMPTLFRELTFDFGTSRDYKDAKYAVFTVSNPSVPKPPDG